TKRRKRSQTHHQKTVLVPHTVRSHSCRNSRRTGHSDDIWHSRADIGRQSQKNQREDHETHRNIGHHLPAISAGVVGRCTYWYWGLRSADSVHRERNIFWKPRRPAHLNSDRAAFYTSILPDHSISIYGYMDG